MGNYILPSAITELSATFCLTPLQNCQMHLYLALHYYRTFILQHYCILLHTIHNFHITTLSCLTPLQNFQLHLALHHYKTVKYIYILPYTIIELFTLQLYLDLCYYRTFILQLYLASHHYRSFIFQLYLSE